jgi:hypothetical protein
VVRLYNPSVNDNRNGRGFWQIKNATGNRTRLQSIRPLDKRRLSSGQPSDT